jgi:hypothetical protein
MITNDDSILYRKYIEMVKLLNIYLQYFPRYEKYAICNRIRNTMYEVFDLITETRKKYYKKTTITQMDIAHERLRMQVHLAKECEYFGRGKDGYSKALNNERYCKITVLIDEIGRMIGAWMRRVKEDQAQ